ncbi:MAG TPA: PIN domain-containing protein [Anaerolineae bacterium]|nr:PIN domain-containing protein [Anaerolineae bacterium]
MSNFQAAFVDTSAWFALKDRASPDHDRAIDFLRTWSGDLITSNFIIDETITVALYKLGYWAAYELGSTLWKRQYAHLIYVTKADQLAAWDLFQRYSDKRFSFTDCTSFVIMRRLGLLYAFAFDDHFEQVGRFIRLPV